MEAARSGGLCLSEFLLTSSLAFPDFSTSALFSSAVLPVFHTALLPGHTQIFITPSVNLRYVLADFIKILKNIGQGKGKLHSSQKQLKIEYVT